LPWSPGNGFVPSCFVSSEPMNQHGFFAFSFNVGGEDRSQAWSVLDGLTFFLAAVP
jgi:hypothetical protein